MNTLDELIAFCKEEEPVGALLLSGEWGCGKTYLIEHEFKEKVKDTTVVLRISLFGMMKIEEIHNAIKHAWLEEYCKLKGFSSVFDIVTKGKKILNKMGFISDAIKGVANTEFLDLVPIKNKMEDKSVVLVFDDLERCNINIVDVLGLINDYCENLKYHTIIIANQEKIVKLKKPFELTAEVQYAANSNNATGDKQNATIVINNLLREAYYMSNNGNVFEHNTNSKFYVPIWHKSNLTIDEAAAYSGIGRDKLYALTNKESCVFVLWVGNRRLIKRRKFDEYIESIYSI